MMRWKILLWIPLLLSSTSCYDVHPAADNFLTPFSSCSLQIQDTDLQEQILTNRHDKHKTEFTLHLDGYNASHDPLSERLIGQNYQPYRWMSVYNQNGLALLSLSFNYDVLSMNMLMYGVEKLELALEENEPGCFSQLTDGDKIRLLRNLVINDFQASNESSLLTDGHYACNQVINAKSGRAEFTYMCCSDEGECRNSISNKWITLIFTLIACIKLGFLFFGPLILQGYIASDVVKTEEYMVQLDEPLTIDVNHEKGTHACGAEYVSSFRQFNQFLNMMKDGRDDKQAHANHIVPDECMHSEVKINTIHVLVDQKRLMSEKNVPVGVFHFLWYQFIRCGIRKCEPFKSCWDTSMMCGSRDPKICGTRSLYCELMKVKCMRVCTWGNVLFLMGKFLLLVLIPSPYYIRVIIYEYYEASEVNNRQEAIDELELKPVLDHNFFQYVTPSHGALNAMYVLYAVSFITLGILRQLKGQEFDDYVLPPLRDMVLVSKIECFHLLMSHLVLPFKSYGLFIGLVLGLFYWPIMMTVCLLVIAIYCLPTVYLCGRFLFSRPARFPCIRMDANKPIGLFELNLNEISHHFKYNVQLENSCVKILLGAVCNVLMISVLLMYAECFGILVEIFMCTLMGVVINAGAAVDFVMLGFWIIAYVASCFNNMHNDYQKLSSEIFKFIKGQLGEQVRQLVKLRFAEQNNTAFRCFSNDTSKDTQDMDQVLRVYEKNCTTETTSHLVLCRPYWKFYDLILFVSKDDVTRITRELFYRICAVEAPGCPGPEYKGLLRAIRSLSVMIVFILFVFLVVQAFETQISSTNQFLVTLAGGFLPFVVRFVLKPKEANIYLNTFTFFGAIHEIIRDFTQVWPVCDLSYTEREEAVSVEENKARISMMDEDEVDDASRFLSVAAAGAMAHAVIGASSGRGSRISPGDDDFAEDV